MSYSNAINENRKDNYFYDLYAVSCIDVYLEHHRICDEDNRISRY